MIDYSKWEEAKLKVSSLYLDPTNPRFTSNDQNYSQNDLINQMIGKYEIYELAKSIATEGFFPDKNLIICKENGKDIVIEGNRRLSAIKALLNPDIINATERSKFKKLSDSITRNYIEKVKVIVAPSRAAANPIVFKEHTHNTAMPWSTIMQAEFYVRLMNNGLKAEEIEKEYNLPKSELIKSLKLHNMYSVACNVGGCNSEENNVLLDKQNFPASVLERVYDSAAMRKALKISFNKFGEIQGNTHKEDFEKAYRKIISDIVQKKIDTRILNKEADRERYAREIKDYLPNTEGKFTQADFSDKPQNMICEESGSNNVQKRTLKNSKGIIPPGIPFKLESATNLKKFYEELRKISVKSYPNASGILLRSFLDKSLRMFLKKQGVTKLEVICEGVPKIEALSDISLGELLEYLVKKDVNHIEDKNVKKVVKQFKSSSDKSSLSALNSLVHSEEYSLSENEIREIWPKLEGLFRIILIEPEKKQS